MVRLSNGSIAKIINRERVEDPILQYLGSKLLASSSGITKYRLMLNDGVDVSPYAMIEPSMNHMITENKLTEFSILKIKTYSVQKVNSGGNERWIIVVHDFDILQNGEEIGDKITYDSKDETAIVKVESQEKSNGLSNLGHQIQRNSSMSSMSSMTNGSFPVTPIAALNPYQSRWVIRVRVTSKSDKRSWSNARGEGTLFSIDLLDESGEIRCTAFKEQCEKYYEMIEVGKVYFISRCSLKPANKQYSSLKNDYEITLNNESEIVLCDEGENEIPTITYDFQPISSIENKEKNDMMDVLGVVKSVGEAVHLTARSTGKDLIKRDVNIVDESNTMVCLTLWGQQAATFSGENNPIIAIKGARIGEFQGGKSLSALSSSVINIDPDIPEAHKLRGWYSSVGKQEESKFLSKTMGAGGSMNGPWLTLKEAKEMRPDSTEAATMYICKSTINFIRHENTLYKACPADGCKKKVVDQSNQMYKCEKCNREYPNFVYRMMASVCLADWSSNQWVSAFSEEAEKMLEISAQELGEMKDHDNDEYLARIAETSFKSFIFKLKARWETFNDEQKLKTTVAGVTPINFKVYNSHLLTKIKELTHIGRA